MATKTKTFDCVEMKNHIQAERWAEYEARKDEFDSYLAFINARVQQSPLWKEFLRKAEGADNPGIQEGHKKGPR